MKYVELLSPAGNIESFKAACQNGADAIYMGVDKFNARTMAQNFTIDEYISCIKYAHIRGIKVFLTLNTLLYDNEIKEALEIILKLYSKGLDAVIVQDIGLAMLIHELLPNLPIHASTQMSVYSLEQVKFLENLGFKRVVLARELSIEEIEYICKNTNVEIEVFVHGALCVSFSGQCLFSSTIGNRSANRGNCAQPCRKRYTLCDSKDKKLIENEYLLSKKDILGIDFLSKLYEAGVYSFKLEGRNKTSEYVAGITSIYRKNIDKFIYNRDIEYKDIKCKYVLKQLFNRNGQSSGYLEGVPKKESITLTSPKNLGLYLGTVSGKKGRLIKLKLKEDINLHDGFEVYSNTGENISSNIVTCIKDENLNLINNIVEKDNVVYIGDTTKNIPIGSKVYKTSNNELNKKLKGTYFNNIQLKKIDVKLNLKIKENNNIEVTYYIFGNVYNLIIDYIPDKAINKSLTKSQIEENFSKTKELPFNFIINDLILDEDIFIPVSKLNFIRNEICNSIDKLFDVNIDISNELKYLDIFLNKKQTMRQNNSINLKNSIYIYSYNKNVDYLKKYMGIKEIYINIVDMYKYEDDMYKKLASRNICLYIPNVVGKNIKKYIEQNLIRIIEKFNIVAISLGSYQFLEYIKSLKEKYNFRLIADYSLNITNIYSANFLKNQSFDELILTFEQDYNSIINISKVINTHLLDGQICVMTSRYCVVGSFLKGKNNGKCTMPCLLDNYHLKDSHEYNYDIVCDNIDCIMKIFRYVKVPDDVLNIDVIKSVGL